MPVPEFRFRIQQYACIYLTCFTYKIRVRPGLFKGRAALSDTSSEPI